MKTTLITYHVKAAKVGEHEALIKAVFQQLNAEQPTGISYRVLNTGDNSFAHLVTFERETAHQNFTNMAAFRDFQADIKSRLEAPPFVQESNEIGMYPFTREPVAIR